MRNIHRLRTEGQTSNTNLNKDFSQQCCLSLNIK